MSAKQYDVSGRINICCLLMKQRLKPVHIERFYISNGVHTLQHFCRYIRNRLQLSRRIADIIWCPVVLNITGSAGIPCAKTFCSKRHKIMLKSLQDIRIINVVGTHQELCNDERHHPGTYGVFHTSEYILLNKLTGDRMHNDGINNTLRRVNKKLATPQKGNHIIRKTYISSLDAYSDLTDEEIRMVAGHKYISTTQKLLYVLCKAS